MEYNYYHSCYIIQQLHCYNHYQCNNNYMYNYNTERTSCWCAGGSVVVSLVYMRD